MNPTPQLTDLLARAPLFATLPPGDLGAIAARMRPRACEAGELIFSRGDEAGELFVVLSGRVRLSILSSDGRELSVAHAASGEIFGEIAVLDGGVRSATATAIAPTRLSVLSRAAFRQAMEAHPRIAQGAIAFLCARLRETDHRLETIALHSIEVRLARFFLSALRLAAPGKSGEAVPLDLGMSQSELALLVGASRPKVNLALSMLEDMGAITRVGAKVKCNTALLEDIAAAD
jgi:CRP/FNR family transcriptional regulator, cyclic AMP receptor protein